MKTEWLSNVFLSMETSANNLFKNFFLCFIRIQGVHKDFKAASGLKMENEAPDLTTHGIKGYAKFTKPTRLKKICNAAMMFQKSLGLHKFTKLIYT